MMRTALVVSLVQAVALGVPAAVLAHDINTSAGHKAEDEVVHDAATEARLNSETQLRSSWASQATAAAVATDPGQVGQWGQVVDWPVVGIHVALLPNGKVLAWDSVGDAATETFPVHNFTRATVYDPITGDTVAGERRYGLQHLLCWFRPPGRRVIVHRRRQQECAAPGDRPDASVQPRDQRLEPRPGYGRRPLVSVGHAAHERRDADHGGRSRHSRRCARPMALCER